MYPIPHADPKDEGLRFETLPALAVVQGERLCDGCGYNLQGQQVRREPRTQLLMARCPECGMYLPANPGPRPTKKWRKPDKENDAASGCFILMAHMIFPMWGLHVGGLDIVTSNRGPTDRMMLNVLVLLLILAMSGVAFGVIHAALLPSTPMRSRLLRSMLYFAPAWLLALVVFEQGELISSYRHDAAQRFMAYLFLGLTALSYGLAAFAASYYGRSLARGLVRLLFAPPWRGTFAALWLVDGRPPPVPRQAPPASTLIHQPAPGSLS